MNWKPWRLPSRYDARRGPMEVGSPLHAQIAVLQFGGGSECRRRAGPDYPPALDEVVAVGDADQRLDVLVDQEDRLSGGLEPYQTRPDFPADERRKPLGCLVENEEMRIG